MSSLLLGVAEDEHCGHSGIEVPLTILITLFPMLDCAAGCAGMNLGRSFKTCPQLRAQYREQWAEMSHAGPRGTDSAVRMSWSMATSRWCTPSPTGGECALWVPAVELCPGSSQIVRGKSVVPSEQCINVRGTESHPLGPSVGGIGLAAFASLAALPAHGAALRQVLQLPADRHLWPADQPGDGSGSAARQLRCLPEP